jgi:membrane protein
MATEPPTHWWERLRDWAEAGGSALVDRIPRPVRAPFAFARDVLKRFGHSGSNLTAAAIAFYGVVGLTPLGIVAVALLQHLAGTRHAAALELERLIREMSPPGAADVVGDIDTLLAFPDPAVTGGLGALALLWAASRLFETIARAVNALWPDSRDRGFFLRQLIGFAGMLVAGAGLTGYMVLVSATAGLDTWLTRLGLTDGRPVLPRDLLPVLIGIPFTFVAFFLLYKLIPTRRIANRAAAAGALAATIGLRLVQPLFAHFLSRTTRPESLYGSLASVVVFALWMYVAGQILLFGAHVVAQVEGAAIVPMEGGRVPRPVNDQVLD